jgi:preprotein translocase subunit SecG
MQWPLSEKKSYLLLAVFLLVALVETALFIVHPEESHEWGSIGGEEDTLMCGDGTYNFDKD